LGHESSSHDESFSFGLLEYPQYTRPASFGGMEVPDVLLSGDHARIAAWRRRESIRRTAEVRPELLEHAMLTDEERAFAAEVADAHEREAAK
jgi:tRNA (guanine37-N1)-methyltransferase